MTQVVPYEARRLSPRNRAFLRRAQTAEAPVARRTLTAAASPIDLTNRMEARKLRVLRQGWQADAAAYVKAVPELSFAYRFLANAAGRMRLFPALVNPEEPDGPPIPAAEHPDAPAGLVDSMAQAMAALGVGRVAIAPLMETLSYGFGVPGEALDVETRVATPTGFVRMGDLVNGDIILGGDGRPCRVLVAHPIRDDRPCYEVRLTNDVRVVADAEHLWVTHSARDRQYARQLGKQYEPTVLTTVEMAESLDRPWGSGHGRNHAIELAAVVGEDHGPRPLPRRGFSRLREVIPHPTLVDPYVLGYWLGDGTAIQGAITVHPDDQPSLRDRVEAAGYGWSLRKGRGFYVGILGLQEQLRTLGVLGDKRIPDAYLRATERDRWALLQGLIDADGHIDKRGGVEFSNTNVGLLHDVVELAASLGLRPSQPSRHRVWFNSAGRPVATLPRKADRITPAKERDRWRYVQSVEQVKSRPVRCITVDSPDRTFLVTEHFVRTHNCFLVGQQGDEDTWRIRSIEEFMVFDDTYKLREVPLDPQGILGWVDLDPDTTYAARLWVPDFSFYKMANSPMRALLDTAEELVLLSRDVRAVARSRLAGGGILKIPEGLRLQTLIDDNEDPESEEWFGRFAEAMIAPLADEGTASAVVPLAVSGDPESLVGLEHMLIERPYSALALELRAEAIGRLATGLDFPREILEGIGDVNHWSGALVSDETFRHHIEPQVVRAVDALSVAYMRTWLAAAGFEQYWVNRACIWYNPVDLISKPDPMGNAVPLFDRYAISYAALREAGGYTEDDKPTTMEVYERQLAHIRTFPPNVLEAIIHAIDPTLVIPPIQQSGQVPGMGPKGAVEPVTPVGPGTAPPSNDVAPPVAPSPVPTAAAESPTVGTPPTGPSLAGMAAEPKALAAKAGHPVPRETRNRLSRRLTEVDAVLRARVQTAASMAVLRLVEKAGAKLRTKVNDRKFKDADAKARAAVATNRALAAALGQPIVAALGFPDSQALLTPDWSELRGQFDRWVTAAQADAIRAARKLAALSPNDPRVEAAAARLEASTVPAWSYLEQQLTAIAERLLYDPDPNALDEVVVNPATVVPPGIIRAALTIAGGGQPKPLTAAGQEQVLDPSQTIDVGSGPVPPGYDPAGAMVSTGDTLGQIGNGSAVASLFGAAGLVPLSYTWEHFGVSDHPFEPHLDLDGVTFTSFDDDALANPGDWPPVAYFLPGDHDGCGCFTGETPVSVTGLLGATRRWYDGDLVEVVTASGHELAGTPNHPILTPDGWVPLGLLNQGDHVVSDRSPISVPDGFYPYDQENPVRIEDLFASLSRADGISTVTVPTAAKDFHGDGGYGDVDVVWSDRLLAYRRETSIDDFVEYRLLESGAGTGVHLSGQSGPQPTGTSAFGIGSVLPLRPGLDDRDRTLTGGPCELAGVADGSNRYAATDEPLPDRSPVDAVATSKSQFCLPGSVSLTDRGDIKIGSPLSGADSSAVVGPVLVGSRSPSSAVDSGESGRPFGALSEAVTFASTPEQAPFDEQCPESTMVDPDRFCGGDETGPGEIGVDCLIQVRRRRFTGHVYNLLTAGGWYFADRIVVHNCDYSTEWGTADEADNSGGDTNLAAPDTTTVADVAPAIPAYPTNLTAKAGAKWLSENWPRAVGRENVASFINLTGLPADIADSVGDTLVSLAQEYPEVAQRLTFFGTSQDSFPWMANNGKALPRMPKGAYAYSVDLKQVGMNMGAIRYSPTKVKDLTMLARDQQAGWLAVGTPEGIVRHEFGHAFEDWLNSVGVQPYQIEKAIREAFEKLTGETSIVPDGNLSRTRVEYVRAKYELTRTGLSRYATTNNHELIAESFSEYTRAQARGAEARPVATAVVEALKGLIPK